MDLYKIQRKIEALRKVAVEQETLLKTIDPIIARTLDRAIDGKELSVEELLELFKAKGLEFVTIMTVADKMREREVGDYVTFVVNRNINFTNICCIRCKFCAFSRSPTDSDAYTLSINEVVKKAIEAWNNSATEVCIQGGINPNIDPMFYVEVCRAIKARLPDIHIHAFSPMEVFYAANKIGLDVKEFLLMLKEAGLDSMPGTAAEILDDEIRKILCPLKIDTRTWIEIIKTAHKLKIPTTSTIMYGHVDTPYHWCKHMILIREIQKETRGFTEFIPLKFVHYNTAIYKEGKARASTTLEEDIKMHSIARLVLGKYVKNIQASWVKLGPKVAQFCLNVGANDLGGTLTEENISRAAGAKYGQYMPAERIVSLIRKIGRLPVQRTTDYKILRTF